MGISASPMTRESPTITCKIIFHRFKHICSHYMVLTIYTKYLSISGRAERVYILDFIVETIKKSKWMNACLHTDKGSIERV